MRAGTTCSTPGATDIDTCRAARRPCMILAGCATRQGDSPPCGWCGRFCRTPDGQPQPKPQGHTQTWRSSGQAWTGVTMPVPAAADPQAAPKVPIPGPVQGLWTAAAAPAGLVNHRVPTAPAVHSDTWRRQPVTCNMCMSHVTRPIRCWIWAAAGTGICYQVRTSAQAGCPDLLLACKHALHRLHVRTLPSVVRSQSSTLAFPMPPISHIRRRGCWGCS